MLENTTNIVLDTDLAGDIDDVGDVGLTCAFVKLGVIRLLGVVATTPFPRSAPCVMTLLDYSLPGHDITVCQYNGAATLPQFSVYCEKVVRRFAKERGSAKSPYLGHVHGYRRLLHSAPERSVIIAMTGTAISISELLLSAADEVSSYTGVELIVSKVKALVWAAGQFPQSRTPEHNIQTDIGAARSLVETWPSSVPVIWACNNIGDVVYSGPPASVDPMISPYRYAYDLYAESRMESVKLGAKLRVIGPRLEFRRGRQSCSNARQSC